MSITKPKQLQPPTVHPPPEAVGPWSVNRIHNVDSLSGLRQIPDDVFDVAVTSPPYWGQRDSAGIGGEPDPRDYIRNLSDILAETLRCLKPTGTLWLNIGDSFNTPLNWSKKDYTYSTLGKDKKGFPATNKAFSKAWGKRRAFIDKQSGWLQYGNLLSIPNRVVLELCDRGFLYRGEVFWLKAHPMPEGLCRRPHRHHEGIYILAKREAHSFQVTACPIRLATDADAEQDRPLLAVSPGPSATGDSSRRCHRTGSRI